MGDEEAVGAGITDRDELEKALLRAELRAAEAPPSRHVIVLAASFQLVEGVKLGCHLNESNVIGRIDVGSLIDQDGTLQLGDRIVAVNATSTMGTSAALLLPPPGSTVSIVVARWAAGAPDPEPEPAPEDASATSPTPVSVPDEAAAAASSPAAAPTTPPRSAR